MKYTRLSLLYPVAILLVSGLLLLIRPGLVFSILQSSKQYPSDIANLLGMMFLGLGALVALIYKYKAEKIYHWTVGIRGFFGLCSIGLYYKYQNLFFISLLLIILIGILLTTLGLYKDNKHS